MREREDIFLLKEFERVKKIIGKRKGNNNRGRRGVSRKRTLRDCTNVSYFKPFA